MNLRNTFAIVLVLWLRLTLATGQEPLSAPVGTAFAPASNPAAGPSAASGQGDPADLTIFFTGRLLGYYRLPEWQNADFEAKCPDRQAYTVLDEEAESDPSLRDKLPPKKPADAFLSDTHKLDGDILVGMGDNFGVTLESRAYKEQPAPDKPWQLHAKSRNLDDKNWGLAPKDQIGDNVGCFLSRAGYDAIIPGNDDFYFGPERLRRIAGRLATVPEKDGMHPVRMLAANLVLKTSYLKKPPEIQDADKDLKFVPGMPTGIKSLDVSDNGTVLPFAKQIRFEVSSTSLYSVAPDAPHQFAPFLCPVDDEGDKKDANDKKEKKNEKAEGLDSLNPKSKSCKFLTLVVNVSKPDNPSTPSKEKATAEKVVWDFNMPADWPPKELPALYGLCASIDPAEFGSKRQDGVYYDKKRKDKGYYCLRFTVVEPLFGDSDSEPYVVKELKNAHDPTKPAYAVIFGVVDKDLTTLVGRDNLAWRNLQPKTGPGKPAVPVGKETYGTTVDTLDEAATLGVAMRNFHLGWRDCDWREKHKIREGATTEPFKILLAQMTRGKAETLAANLANTKISDTSLRFDVVISAATDFSAATADEDVTFNRPSKVKKTKADDSTPEFQQFVAVPWQGYDPENSRLPNPVRSLTLADSDYASGLYQKRTFFVFGHYDHTFPIQETIGKTATGGQLRRHGPDLPVGQTLLA